MKIQRMTMRPAPLLSKGCPIGMKPARTVPVSVVLCGSKRGPRITHERHSNSTFTIACLPSGLALLNVVVGNMGSSRLTEEELVNWWINWLWMALVIMGRWRQWNPSCIGLMPVRSAASIGNPSVATTWKTYNVCISVLVSYVWLQIMRVVWTLNSLNIVEQQHVIKRYQKKIINKS